MKKWIAVCGRPLCGDLNALLHIAVIFTTHRKRNVVICYKYFLYESFQKKLLPIFSNCVFCSCTHNIFLTLSLGCNCYIYTM